MMFERIICFIFGHVWVIRTDGQHVCDRCLKFGIKEAEKGAVRKYGYEKDLMRT